MEASVARSAYLLAWICVCLQEREVGFVRDNPGLDLFVA